MPTKKQDKTTADLNKTAKKLSGTTRPSKIRSFPVIGIGGSAGAFPAMEKFFTHMPADSGMAFVIIMHLDPDHQGQISSVIRNYTMMPVHEAVDGMPVEPDHIYVIPPNRDMGIHNRKLLLLNVATPNGFRQPVDYFFQSLADDQWNRAVAIVLSGMGSDGETGVRMIKEKLGMAMVQDPSTAQYNSMPRASIGTNLVDYVLAPEEMPLKLIQYLNHPVLTEEPTEQARSEIRNSTSVEKILMLLRTQTGHDFSLYKKNTIVRRIDRRVAFHQLPDYVHYVTFLRENPQEIDVLFNELLIGVTKFFRDAPAFDSLKHKLGDLIQFKKTGEPIRVWIAGCSTGEEAYSVAMLIMECLEAQPKRKAPKIQVFATDLDVEAIEQARQGIYHDNIAADVSPERLERFFNKTESGYQVKKELREMIVFAQHNLIKDAPFTRLDLLCCRNVMIYLTTELQKKIIPIFHYSLNNKGIMFMGPAETIGGFTELFMPFDPKWKLFERKEGSAALNKMIDFPFHVARQPTAILRAEDNEKPAAKSPIAETFNNVLLENFTPTSLLINDKGDILYTSGRSGNYLQLPRGEAVMNIHKMAREDLRYVLGNVIHQARNQKGLVSINEVKYPDGDVIKILSLHASPVTNGGLHGLMLVVIEEKGIVKKNSRKNKKADGHDQAIEEMEKELVYTKQQLNSTIEQMETSLEELKSTNEELQSTNEELQSTNEESLTTKEEMQSLNEELMTVNVQYQAKADELSRLNNDMKNLLDATEIGTIFLNNELEILRYTPPIKKMFNIIPTDVGRPLSDIVSNFDYVEVMTIIRDVIDRLFTREVEVRTKTNDWYTIRIMPYRTMDNFISGAVLTFSLITGYKQMEFRLNALRKYAASVCGQLKLPTLQLDEDLRIMNANPAFRQTFLVDERTLQELAFPAFAAERWQLNGLGALLERGWADGQTVKQDLEVSGKAFELVAEPFVDEQAGETLLLTITLHPKP